MERIIKMGREGSKAKKDNRERRKMKNYYGGHTTANAVEMKRIIQYKQPDADMFENLDDTAQFRKEHNSPKLYSRRNSKPEFSFNR